MANIYAKGNAGSAVLFDFEKGCISFSRTGWANAQLGIVDIELSFDEQLIYNALDGNELHFDELLKETKLETKVLLTMLMRMEIRGIVNKLPGNYYSINK